MEIKNLFKKNIERDIQGVVTIGNEEESRKKQELEEYVCTQEVIKNMRTFFSAYRKSINQPTEQIGVWITGFFGSGKSHFLKIMGYLLSNEVVAGKHAIEYFEDKIQDETIKADMQLSASQNNLVVLFNIDAKAKSNAKNTNSSIMETMLGAFNEKLGYAGATPWLAQFERILDNEGIYDLFKNKFQEISGKNWIEARRIPLFLTDNMAKVLSEIKGISLESARNDVKEAMTKYSISIEDFSQIISDYIKRTDQRVVFLIDEVGQFIGTRGELMLGLQTVEEELGKACKGKAWLAVTSQQEIKDLVDNVNKNAQNDFSKIQGRFNTRLMMSSSNADEVIKKRLLDKTDDARNLLGTLYDENKDRLNNLLIFPQKPKWTGYENQQQFIDCYPFVNYQFELLQLTFTAIREGGMSEGKHISSGERSLMNAFQKSAISKKNLGIGTLIPFNDFYETIEEFMDHDIKKIFYNASRRLTDPFDIEVLKVLFMLKNVKDMEPTLERISSLMVSHIDEDKKALKDRIKTSLDHLIGETYAQKNGERYEFLTNREQDVNREINKAAYSTSEVLTNIRNIIFDNIVEISNKFTYGKYQFNLNRYIDDTIQGTDSPDNLTIKIYTPWADRDKDFALESTNNQALVINLTNGTYLEELIQANKIQTFDRNNAAGADSTLIDILTKKRAEADERIKRAEKVIRNCLLDSDFYQNGSKLNLTAKDEKKKVLEGLEKVVKNKYHKIEYIKTFATKADDIITTLKTPKYEYDIFDPAFYSNALAAKAIYEQIQDDKNWRKKTTVGTLISKFSKAPCGYRILDIRDIIAVLLVNDKVKAKIADQVQNIHNQIFMSEFSRGTQEERMVIELQTEIDPSILMKVKKIMKSAFDVTLDLNESALRDGALSYLKEKSNSLKDISRYQQGNYPGKKWVDSMLSCFATIVMADDSETVFKRIIEKEVDLITFGEKIDSIINFYNTSGSQMKTWEEAKKITGYYRENYFFIPELSQIEPQIDEINKILSMDEPFGEMVKLGQLVSEANQIKENFIAKAAEVAKNEIIECLNIIDKEQHEATALTFNKEETKDRIHKLFGDYRQLYIDLQGMLDTYERINNSKEKAKREVEVFRTELNKIIQDDRKVDVATDNPVITSVVKKTRVRASSLIPIANKNVKTAQDVDNLVNNVKEYLLRLLNDNDEVDID